MIIIWDVVDARVERAGWNWVDWKMMLFSECVRVVEYSFSAVSVAGTRYADNF